MAHTQDWTALVYVDPKDAAEPEEVRAELFFRGKKRGEHTLLVRGRLAPAVAVRKSGGSEQIRFGILGAAVSPDGVHIALLSGSKILVFREEEFVGAVDADFLPKVAMTREYLFWCPWAHRKAEPLLMRWHLSGGEPPEPVLAHEAEKGVGKKLLAVRSDGQLWLVDAFTGEPWLLAADGRVKRRLEPLRAAPPLAKEITDGRRGLEDKVPAHAFDATKTLPSVELYSVENEALVAEVYALGNDLLVSTGSEPGKVFWFAENDAVWRCAQFPPEVGADATTLVVTRDGFWVKGKEGTFFYSGSTLREGLETPAGAGTEHAGSGS